MLSKICGAAMGQIEESTRRCLSNIKKYNKEVNAYITVMESQAISQAQLFDAAILRGETLGLLAGMPVSIKDCIDVAGVPCTNGTEFFRDYVPNHDATVVSALRRAGAIIIGKTNLHEFCYGATTQNPHYGSTQNPWDLKRIPSGSSGGAAAALASNMCVGAVGSDTGGSIRVPAAVTGVCGLRPTLGAVPMSGSRTRLCPAIDTAGPMARSAIDLARMFSVLAFYDDEDPYSVLHIWDNFLGRLNDGISEVKIGIPENYFFDNLDPGIGDAVNQAARKLENLGAKLIPLALEGAEEAHSRVMPMVWADLFQFHKERVEADPGKFGEDVLNRILLGQSVTGRDYSEALRYREKWNKVLSRAYQKVDVILTPTTPVIAPLKTESKDMVATTHRLTWFTFPFSWAGVPGISLPCGFNSGGMPIGMQLHSRKWEEGLLFRIGVAYQSITGWHLKNPENFP